MISNTVERNSVDTSKLILGFGAAAKAWEVANRRSNIPGRSTWKNEKWISQEEPLKGVGPSAADNNSALRLWLEPAVGRNGPLSTPSAGQRERKNLAPRRLSDMGFVTNVFSPSGTFSQNDDLKSPKENSIKERCCEDQLRNGLYLRGRYRFIRFSSHHPQLKSSLSAAFCNDG